MNFEIRNMQPEDGPRVLEILQQGIDGRKSTFETEVPTWESWEMKYIDSGRLVIENSENLIVGWAAMQSISQRPCYNGVAEVSIYVDTDYQGQGLGKLLLQKSVLLSEEHGFWTLQAGIFPENTFSTRLFQSLGFRNVGKREKIAKLDGQWKDIILMERRSTIIY